MRIRRIALVVAALTAVSLPASAAPLTAPPHDESSSNGRLVIHATGDVLTSPEFVPAFRAGDYASAWAGLGGIFLRDDLTLMNLECDPSTVGTAFSDKPFSFRCPLTSLASMRAAGVDVASLGNNHSADFGYEGLLDGITNLSEVGLTPVGAGADLDAADQAVFFDLDGWRVAVLGFSAVSGIAYDWPYSADDYANLRSRWFATADRPGIAPATIANMTAAVEAARPHADIVIVMLHQGVYNMTLQPFPDEVGRAHALIDAGADVVFAHHHHRVLPVETYHDRPIFYGLGSFVFTPFEPIRNVSSVGEVIVSPDGTIRGRLIPAHIGPTGTPVLLGPPDYQVRLDRVRIR